MPKHIVHEYLAEKFCRLPADIMKDINNFRDVIGKCEEQFKRLMRL